MKPLQGGLICRELQPVIFFYTGEALLRMWSKLSTAAIRELFDIEGKGKGDQEEIVIEKAAIEERDVMNQVGVNDGSIGEIVREQLSVEVIEIPVSDLFREFQDIFNFFYPDGISMSNTEKEEVFELFTVWMQEQKYRSKIRFDGAAYCEVQTISFKLFHNWFFDLSQMIHDVMSDRLMKYILLSSNLYDNIGVLKNPNKVKSDLKLLNPITSQILRDADAKYSAAPNSSHLFEERSRNHNNTENPLQGLYRNPSNLHGAFKVKSRSAISAPDALPPVDSDDLYSLYAENPIVGSLLNSVTPQSHIERNQLDLTCPLHREHLIDSDDLYAVYPYGPFERCLRNFVPPGNCPWKQTVHLFDSHPLYTQVPSISAYPRSALGVGPSHTVLETSTKQSAATSVSFVDYEDSDVTHEDIKTDLPRSNSLE